MFDLRSGGDVTRRTTTSRSGRWRSRVNGRSSSPGRCRRSDAASASVSGASRRPGRPRRWLPGRPRAAVTTGPNVWCCWIPSASWASGAARVRSARCGDRMRPTTSGGRALGPRSGRRRPTPRPGPRPDRRPRRGCRARDLVAGGATRCSWRRARATGRPLREGEHRHPDGVAGADDEGFGVAGGEQRCQQWLSLGVAGGFGQGAGDGLGRGREDCVVGGNHRRPRRRRPGSPATPRSRHRRRCRVGVRPAPRPGFAAPARASSAIVWAPGVASSSPPARQASAQSKAAPPTLPTTWTRRPSSGGQESSTRAASRSSSRVSTRKTPVWRNNAATRSSSSVPRRPLFTVTMGLLTDTLRARRENL